MNKKSLLKIIIPGLLVAATGVGAGDLATASFAGSQLGVAILWAVLLGGIMKFILTEGLARWQLATGTTFLEGVAEKFGIVSGVIFMPYLFLWTFFVGSALMSFKDIQKFYVVIGALFVPLLALLLIIFYEKKGGSEET